MQEARGGVRLLLDVTPGARLARFPDGFDAWRGRIGLRVRAPADGGRANEEALAAVAEYFGLPVRQVRLESGARDPRKVLHLEGIDRQAAVDRLRGPLEGGA